MPKSKKVLRSQRWFLPDTMRAFAHRQRTMQIGYKRSDFIGKPVIGIINTWSDINTCHAHLRERAQFVREGIIRAGGFPLELPAMSLGEVMVKPTTMFYRNLLAIETEELIRSHPLDGVVLMGGCDKTTPGLLMGAFSVDVPAIFVPAGAALSGHFKGKKIGTGTHTKFYWQERRAGNLSNDDWLQLEESMTRAHGTCNTMGTASTMTGIAETLGMTLPGASTIPAVDSAHYRLCSASGERIVDMVHEELIPSKIVTEASIQNSMIFFAAIGGSTNAAIHLSAMANRLGFKANAEDMDHWSQKVPVILNLMPAGDYLMEDFYYAGGLPALLKRLIQFLDLSTLTVTGHTLGDNIIPAEIINTDVIRPVEQPITKQAAIAVLSGNLCPNGAVIKPSAASEHLLVHRGPALVFENHAELSLKIDDPNLNVDKNTVLVLKNAGPKGGPGMPEWGNLPIPKKLLEQGVRDMVRLSDARMSGTHFGTCILHISPESYIGGPLALIKTGDIIELNVPERQLNVLLSAEELAERQRKWVAPLSIFTRGYGVMYQQHVTQAEEGCDFDFLTGKDNTPEPEIY